MRRGELYLFSEVKGQWKRIGYSAGIGVANKTYSQENYSFNYWTFRPELTLNYEILTGLNARYTFETYRRVSSYAMVSDARIREIAVNGRLEILICNLQESLRIY